MSKNNTIRRSDKKFIRLEKARIRKQFFDVAKQEELINELYKSFIPKTASEVAAKKEAKSAAKVERKKAASSEGLQPKETKSAPAKDSGAEKEAPKAKKVAPASVKDSGEAKAKKEVKTK